MDNTNDAGHGSINRVNGSGYRANGEGIDHRLPLFSTLIIYAGNGSGYAGNEATAEGVSASDNFGHAINDPTLKTSTKEKNDKAFHAHRYLRDSLSPSWKYLFLQ